MKLTSGVQEALVALLCFDETPRGAKYVRALVPSRLMDVYYRDFAAEAETYLDKYDKPPGAHTLDILDVLKSRNPDRAKIYERIYSSLVETAKSVNRDYILDRAAAFAKSQRVKTGVAAALEGLELNTEEGVNKAETALLEALKESGKTFDPGVFLHDRKRVMELVYDESEGDTCPQGIPELDRKGLCPTRGTVLLFCGAPKAGKTWYGLNCMKHAGLHGWRTAYLSLEVGEKILLRRTIQTHFALTKRDAEEVFRVAFKRDEKGAFTSWKRKTIGKRLSLLSDAGRAHVAKRLKRFERAPKSVVKRFPTGELTVRDVDAYLDSLEGLGFLPDLLVVDYPDLMKLDAKNQRQSVGNTLIGLRGIAVRRNIAVVAMSQINRVGADATSPDVTNIAEDWSKIATADVVLVYARTDHERELGLARLLAAAGRDDEDRFTVLLSQAYKIGQFCLDSVRMKGGTYWDKLAESKGEQADEDDDTEEIE